MLKDNRNEPNLIINTQCPTMYDLEAIIYADNTSDEEAFKCAINAPGTDQMTGIKNWRSVSANGEIAQPHLDYLSMNEGNTHTMIFVSRA